MSVVDWFLEYEANRAYSSLRDLHSFRQVLFKTAAEAEQARTRPFTVLVERGVLPGVNRADAVLAVEELIGFSVEMDGAA